MKRVLIVGYGSIGKRHADIISSLGHSVSLVTQQKNSNYVFYSSVANALMQSQFDYIIISNSTHLHAETLQDIVNSNFCGTLLIEKPIFSTPAVFDNIHHLKIFVGYNLRFHPILQRLKEILIDEKIISFSAYVGQYLPTWRPHSDYHDCYSAKKNQGGGVLRDLSHELDYATWLCGDCLEVTALGGKWSELEIDSDDTYSMLMRCEHAPVVMIYMDYLSRIKTRKIIVQTQKHTIFADLVQHFLSIDDCEEKFHPVNTYVLQHQAILLNDYQQLCSYFQGVKIVKLIDAIEYANAKRQWVSI